MKKILLIILTIILIAAIVCMVLIEYTRKKTGSELPVQQTEAELTQQSIEEDSVKETEETYGYIEGPASEEEELSNTSTPTMKEDDTQDLQEELPESTANPTTVATEATEPTTAPTIGTESDVVSPPSNDEGAAGAEEEM